MIKYNGAKIFPINSDMKWFGDYLNDKNELITDTKGFPTRQEAIDYAKDDIDTKRKDFPTDDKVSGL